MKRWKIQKTRAQNARRPCRAKKRGIIMITKFKSIKNMAVFNDFEWDSSVKAKNGRVLELKKINVFYGRNYSGKTTLSRIIRALETGIISDKYIDHEFEVIFKDGQSVKHQDLQSHGKDIRVFNDDFVRENLHFIFNPDEDIESFAVLGSDNNVIETQIANLTDELGSSDEGNESGLYLALKISEADYLNELSSHDNASKSLEEKIRKKAIDRNIGIKYKPGKFGDQNYTTAKMKTEINRVLSDDYICITEDETKKLHDLLKETPKQPIQRINTPNLNFHSLSIKAKGLIEKTIAESDKIEELVNNAILNRWVSEGRGLHKEREKCAFCGNPISTKRWEALEKHFDKESEQLEKDIDSLIKDLETDKEKVSLASIPNIDNFYSEFKTEIEAEIEKKEEVSQSYISSLNKIISQLKARKDSIIHAQEFDEQNDFSEELSVIYDEFEKIRLKSEQYTSQLKEKQNEAKTSLRLKEVYDFVQTINYQTEHATIENLHLTLQEKERFRNSFSESIKTKLLEIEEKKRLLNDEEEGAKQVNMYLKNFFGHQFLSLESIELESDDTDQEKKVRFQIVRDGKKAHNLSEGECSLISFCYFIAKLNDINTSGKKPIIWIDDPISSLDANHIFFMYSIIKSEIVDTDSFGQLFVSTHNLDFLKYLKRLNGGIIKTNGKFSSYEKDFFVINREDKFSSIIAMPKYLKEYVTEYNFLFDQIYKCSQINEITDKNYTVFYNFGNNARKFLEIYLYYRFPDETSDIEKLKAFFDDKPIPAVLTDRINNEYSHLSGCLERGQAPVDAPEMKSTARLIIQKIKDFDEKQYNALLSSIT
jgi:wobble nucleotide-excising tRNase